MRFGYKWINPGMTSWFSHGNEIFPNSMSIKRERAKGILKIVYNFSLAYNEKEIREFANDLSKFQAGETIWKTLRLQKITRKMKCDFQNTDSPWKTARINKNLQDVWWWK